MKSTKWVLGAIVALVLLLVGAGWLLPERAYLEYKTNLDRSPEVVYSLLADPSEFKKWVPWQGAEEGVEYSVENASRGLNASVEWHSEDSDVGSGRLTVIDAQPYRKLRMLLDYNDGARAVLGFHLEPLDSGTHVTWTYETEYGDNPFARYKGLLHSHRVESLYDPSLDRLRRLTDSETEQSEPAIVTETITYEVDGASYEGYFAYDQNRHNRPGVLIVHEWWGHTDYVRRRAEQLAGLGYVAFALDMYGEGKTVDHPDQAGRLSKQVNENFDAARERFTEALRLLRNHPATDPEQMAAIGYCFGGGIVLNMARAGVDLDGVVSFHGSLGAPANGRAERGEVNASILVLNGAADPFVSQEQIQSFMQEMDSAGVDYEFINYPGAKHAFTNPAADEYGKQFDLPLEYNANADKQSWQQMRNFFDRIFM